MKRKTKIFLNPKQLSVAEMTKRIQKLAKEQTRTTIIANKKSKRQSVLQ